MPEIKIDFDVYCATCGEGLCGVTTGEIIDCSFPDRPEIIKFHCSRCGFITQLREGLLMRCYICNNTLRDCDYIK